MPITLQPKIKLSFLREFCSRHFSISSKISKIESDSVLYYFLRVLLRYPKSINYGAMGVVMGHELSHAFDDQGREYDEVGNMRDWWNNATLQQFKARTKCIEDQYSGYNISAQNVSGSLTLGENIADNGGLQTAYDAYKAWLKEKHIVTEAPLPGLNHTHDQLFFLSFAQVYFKFRIFIF